MAAEKEAVSFNEIIQADRQRRKNEALASQIFGQGRRSSAPPNSRKPNNGPGPSLASRVGVNKRTAPTAPTALAKSNINSKWGHDLHHINNPRTSRVAALPRTNSDSRLERNRNRLYDGLFSDQTGSEVRKQANISGRTGNGVSDLSIRGAGSLWTVVASNFARGTTAADIEAVFAPIGGQVHHCRLASAEPTVICEITFLDKQGAERVVSTFNNKKADGRQLYVYMKEPLHPPRSVPDRPAPPTGPAGHSRQRPERDLMDVDDERSGREEYDRPDRRADADYVDGRYGFGGSSYRGGRRDGTGGREGQGLFSDRMVRPDRDYRQ